VKVKYRKLAMKELKADLRKEAEAKTLLKRHEALAKLKLATPVDTGEARDGWKINGTSLENAVEHIEALNDGSSPQAEKKFVERTLLGIAGVEPDGIIVVPKKI